MKDSSTNILTTQIGLQNVVIYIQISDELIITKVLISKAASPNVLKKNVIRIFTNIWTNLIVLTKNKNRSNIREFFLANFA